MTPLGYALELLRQLMAGKAITAERLLDTFAPLLLELAMDPAVLTDEYRARIDARIHGLARQANLVEKVDIP